MNRAAWLCLSRALRQLARLRPKARSGYTGEMSKILEAISNTLTTAGVIHYVYCNLIGILQLPYVIQYWHSASGWTYDYNCDYIIKLEGVLVHLLDCADVWNAKI